MDTQSIKRANSNCEHEVDRYPESTHSKTRIQCGVGSNWKIRSSEAGPLSKQRHSATVERRVEEIVIPRNAMIADVFRSHKAQSSKHLACRGREGLDYLSLLVLVLAPEIQIEQHFETRRDLAKKSLRLQEILVGGEQD